MAAIGDVNGAGVPGLAVGAPRDRALGKSTGGVWILSLATSAEHDGSGLNPHTLTQASEPDGTARVRLAVRRGR